MGTNHGSELWAKAFATVIVFILMLLIASIACGTYGSNAAPDNSSKVAGDISKAAEDAESRDGKKSTYYAAAKAAMDAGTKWSVKLANGQTMTYRIIGIDHDDLADGTGKAGLTFKGKRAGKWSSSVGSYRMNATRTNAGGWEKSELRQKMNSGEIWNLMPAEFQGKVRAVKKLTNNVGGTDNSAAVTATTDKLFLLSYSEVVETPYASWASSYPWIGIEGT